MKVKEPVRKYDFWLKNGHVIDPARGIDGVADVLVRNSRMMPVPEEGIDPKDVKEIFDCSGYYVFPGLVNYHAHYAWHNNLSSISPEIFELPNGVTTVCDAGSTGCAGFEGFLRTTLLPAGVTMKAFINVAAGGLACSNYLENISPENFDQRRLEYLFEMYPEHIAGLKLRIGKDINDGMGLAPLKAAAELARSFNTRLALHATYPLEPMQEILPYLGEGDVLCHTLQKMGQYNILDENGRILQEVWDAKERGVIFDCAHGRIHCSFDIFRAAMDQGFLPDMISTDGIGVSMYRTKLFSLPVVMSRLLALGMPIVDVVRATTETPAKNLGLEGKVGTLAPGAQADICVMKKDVRPVTFTDSYGVDLKAEYLLVPQMTLRAGKLVFCDSDFAY